VFTILYRCLYREHWYDCDPVDDWNYAVQLANQIKAQRRTPVMIVDNSTGARYSV